MSEAWKRVGAGSWAMVLLVFAASALSVKAQSPVTTVRFEKQAAHGISASAGASEVVAWLVSLESNNASNSNAGSAPRHKVQLVQHNKSFEPHLLVVPVGTVVDFPNKDPFFHNVFSLFEGKRFDLGLYEAGATNSVRFDRVGVSFLFCNIHPEMSAVVVAVNTRFYGVSDATGKAVIQDVPDGKYELHIWYEQGSPEELKKLTRTVELRRDERDLGVLKLAVNPSVTLTHKNKYGEDYAPVPAQAYSH